jgi:2-isopropylmalate synthase
VRAAFNAVRSSSVRRRAASRAAWTSIEGDYEGTGNGPVSAFTHALAAAGIEVGINDFTEHATARGQGSAAMAYVECRVNGAVRWGAGQDTSVLTASILAVLSAVNRGV